MLKGYIGRESLGTPALNSQRSNSAGAKYTQHYDQAIVTAKIRLQVKNQGAKHTQPYNIAVYNCSNSLHECVLECEQSSPEGVRLE